MGYRLGLNINLDNISWSVLKDNNIVEDCGSFVMDINPSDRDNFLKGESIRSFIIKHSVRKRRKQKERYKRRRTLLIKKLSDIGFFNPKISDQKFSRKYIYELRCKAQREQITKDEFSIICMHFNKNRGYYHNRILDNNIILNEVKKNDGELLRSDKTLSQFLLDKLSKTEHSSIKKFLFSREIHIQDFKFICNLQSKFYQTLTHKVLSDIQKRIIFYQKDYSFSNRKYNDCPFEKFHKNVHISNPIFGDFLVWKQLNKLIVYDAEGYEYILDIKTKRKLFDIISKRAHLDSGEILEELVNIGDIEDKEDWATNLEKINGNYLRYEIEKIFKKYNLSQEKIEELTTIDYKQNNVHYQPFFDIWHSIYSIPHKEGLEKKLIQKYLLPPDAVKEIIDIRLNEKTHFGYISARACRKLIIKMQDGYMYSMACKKLGYNNYNKVILSKNVKKESPISRLILNRLSFLLKEITLKYNIESINVTIDKYIYISKEMRENRMNYILGLRDDIKNITYNLKSQNNNKFILNKDIEKYKLWKETKGYDLINQQNIDVKNLFSDNYEILDILGKEVPLYYSNKVITHKSNIKEPHLKFCDRVTDKHKYINFINTNIRKNVPVERYLKYLGVDMKLNFGELSFFKERLNMLLSNFCTDINIICRSKILKLLYELSLVNILKHIEKENYLNHKLIEKKETLQGNNLERIKKWRKIDDTRYFILKSIVANIDNAYSVSNETKESIINSIKTVLIYNEHKDNILFNNTKNPTKKIHRDTFYGKIRKKIKIDLNKKTSKEDIDNICNSRLKNLIIDRLNTHYKGDLKKCFSEKELKNNPLIHNLKDINSVYIWKEIYTTKKEINRYLPIEKIIDNKLRETFENIVKYKGKNSLDKDDILIENTILKSVKIEDRALDLKQIKENTYVYLRDNHHVSVFVDNKKNLYPQKSTYWDVLQKKYKEEDIFNEINTENKRFLYSLKINDYILFTHKNIDLEDTSVENKKYISDNLFRVQKLTVRSSGQIYFWFRHHKEHSVNNNYPFTEKIVSSLKNLYGYKVELDILGKIKLIEKLYT